jgi:acetyltransferase-like isoleucine patch superfamily enzyme
VASAENTLAGERRRIALRCRHHPSWGADGTVEDIVRQRLRRWLQPRLHRLAALHHEVMEIRAGDPVAARFAAFGQGSVIEHPAEHLGNTASVALGDRVLVRPRVTFEALAPPGTVVIQLGDDVYCGYGARFVAVNGIEVGAGCTVGHGATLADTVHDYKAAPSEHFHATGLKLGRPLRLGEGAMVGNNCVVAGGIEIGAGAIIAPNTFVNRDVPARCLVGGNPARVQRRQRDDGTWETVEDQPPMAGQ